MYFNLISFIIYLFSFFFNILYLDIFKNIKRHIFPKLYSTYTIKNKFYYLFFFSILCIINLCKIIFFINVYILLIYKILFKIYINVQLWLKKKNIKFLYLSFINLWFNLLIHLKVLNRKFMNPVDLDINFYILKWNYYYYYYYIIYMFKDLGTIVIWVINQRYILYVHILFYFKNKKIEFLYFIQWFVNGFLFIYCWFSIKNYIKNGVKSIKGKFRRKKKKKKGSMLSNIKFYYHRNKRILKEKYFNKVKQPWLNLGYSLNNTIEYIFFVLFKTGANFIIYYFYKIIKYSYSICVYIWKSDVIYRFLKLLERKKW